MTKKTYIFGHKNPDTDSICAAVAYANLKNKLGEEVVPARLGQVNQETKFALDYFKVEEPIIIKNIKPQVSDLNLNKVIVVHEEQSIKSTLDIILNQTGRCAPVVNNDNRLIGIVSISDIMPIYTGFIGKQILKETATPFQNVLKVLDGKVVSGNYPSINIIGDIYAISEIHNDKKLDKGDIILTSNTNELVEKASNTNASCIIVYGCEDKNEINVSNEYDGTIICVRYSVFETIHLIYQSIPIRSLVKKQKLEYFVTYETIDDVKENMLSSRYRRFPVVDEWGYIQGMISRSNLFDMKRKRVILVDHNEKGQSISGIEEAEIIEVIDHHRVANIQTMAPLYFRIEPLGCTCTIVAKMYEENNIEIEKNMAGIMLSAILSDTLVFKSPTCTVEDKRIAFKLAKISDVDINKYGMKMIIEGTSIKGLTPKEILNKDMKKFTFGSYKVVISQINTADFNGFFEIYEDMLVEMEQNCKENNLNMFVLIITDIVLGGSEIIVVGEDKWIAQNAFNIDKDSSSIFLSGVFSRKKQIVPELMNAAKL